MPAAELCFPGAECPRKKMHGDAAGLLLFLVYPMTAHTRKRLKRRGAMFSTALFGLTLAFSGVLLGSTFTESAYAATTVISPSSMNDWAFQTTGTASGQMVTGPST